MFSPGCGSRRSTSSRRRLLLSGPFNLKEQPTRRFMHYGTVMNPNTGGDGKQEQVTRGGPMEETCTGGIQSGEAEIILWSLPLSHLLISVVDVELVLGDEQQAEARSSHLAPGSRLYPGQ
ncbi:unnamed protein product [Pleuronectes platessa]|uniref:Uncharacterized protein n=1 Tax=Pleuronectes platessa TaxID=8262 RepID=A0A9N7UWL5_PLEPL|nr:unnamed protein product [Pleuronectes platessa]